MRRIFVTTKEFDKLWKSLGNSDSEFRILENELIYDRKNTGNSLKH